jgi:hypothetical protein
MDTQENQDLEDLLEVQEDQGCQEHLELKARLVIKGLKESQVCQVR